MSKAAKLARCSFWGWRGGARMSGGKANVVYIAPVNPDAVRIAFWIEQAEIYNLEDGSWFCCVCCNEGAPGCAGKPLGFETACPAHPFQIAELTTINRLLFHTRVGEQETPPVEQHKEGILKECLHKLNAAAGRKGLKAIFDNGAHLWRLEIDPAAAALAPGCGADDISSGEVDVYDNTVLHMAVYNRLFALAQPDAPYYPILTENAKELCGLGDARGSSAMNEFLRSFIDKFRDDWGNSAKAVTLLNSILIKALKKIDRSFGSDIQKINSINILRHERYMRGCQNEWSRLFGIRPLPILADERQREAAAQKKASKKEMMSKKRHLDEMNEAA